MIIYNVTINIDEEVHLIWLEWMKNVHIPEVMATGMFESSKMLRLLSTQEDETGVTFAVQYYCESLEKYHQYQNDFAPVLQAETQKHFGGKFAAFRTLLEEI